MMLTDTMVVDFWVRTFLEFLVAGFDLLLLTIGLQLQTCLRNSTVLAEASLCILATLFSTFDPASSFIILCGWESIYDLSL